MESSSRRHHSKLYVYYSTMGYIFQIVRDIDPKLRMLMDTFTLLGVIWSTRSVLRLLASLYYGLHVHVVSRFTRLDLVKRYGRWAVITGATDGVGLEYARQLAARGLSIVIIGRNQAKLGRVKEELLAKHGERIQVQTLEADLNSDDASMYARLNRELHADGKEIGILVNNAGVMYDSPNRFLDQPESKIWEHVRVNMLAVAMITRLVLPSMVQRRKGLVVNMSSIAAYQPLPLMGIYSASKAFVENFSHSLHIEYKQYNIEVQTLTPNYISTKMTTFSGLLQSKSISFPSARAFTSNAIATIGRTGYASTTGYWYHELQQFFVANFMPDWLYRSVSWYVLSYIDDTKKTR